MRVEAGELFAVFGPNGSGKTTLLRVLATLTRPDAGSISVNGFDIARQAIAARATTGAVMHAPLLYADLTGRENLLFHARMFRIDGAGERVEEVAARMNVGDRLDDRVRHLSHGFQKRLSLARALLHRPRLLLLDEPESGLDRPTLRLLERLLDEYTALGGSVVMTTHSLEWGLRVADRVAVLARGRLAFTRARAEITLEELGAAYDRLGGEL